MATYTQVKRGSRGDSVSELQKLLNQKGYSLSVDGIFGQNTQAAVRDYQQKNNLSVDGIAGEQTWSSLMQGNSAMQGAVSGGSSSSKSTADWLADYEGNRPAYTPSQSVTNAQQILAQYEASRPGAYQSQYQAQIDALLNQIMNREKFSYDFNADPLYQQLSQRYQQQGKLAMMDTMGQAAALTGGYGSSYAQTAGQQAYQGYLQQMNDVIPELWDAAYTRYQNDAALQAQNLALLQSAEESAYGRYQDSLNDYYNQLGYLADRADSMSEQEYNRYLNDLAAWQDDRAYYYGKSQDELAQQNYLQELALQQAKLTGSGGDTNDITYAQATRALLDDKQAAEASVYGSGYADALRSATTAAYYGETSAVVGFIQTLMDRGLLTEAGAEQIYLELEAMGYGDILNQQIMAINVSNKTARNTALNNIEQSRK